MPIGDKILKIGSGIGHVVTGVLALDCINNLVQGNYEIAAIEGIGAAYIQISKKMGRDQAKFSENFNLSLKQLALAPVSNTPNAGTYQNLDELVGKSMNYFGNKKK